MTGPIHFERHGDHVAVLTIDNPPMNVLGQAMREAFIAALDRVEADKTVRALLITGTGRAFCAGDDLKQGKAAEGGPAGFAALLTRLDDIRVPIIAAINGWCVGGGFELALACDIRIASTDARFTCAGVNMGLITSAYRLPHLIGVSRAKAMALTGSAVEADKAEQFGLVTELHASQDLLDAGLRLAERIASRAPLSVEATKRVAGRAMGLSPEEADILQADLMRDLRASADHAEAVAAFREKRDPVFTGR